MLNARFCFEMITTMSLILKITRGGKIDDTTTTSPLPPPPTSITITSTNSDNNVSFAPEGYKLKWKDDFDGAVINTTNWVIAR